MLRVLYLVIVKRKKKGLLLSVSSKLAFTMWNDDKASFAHPPAHFCSSALSLMTAFPAPSQTRTSSAHPGDCGVFCLVSPGCGPGTISPTSPLETEHGMLELTDLPPHQLPGIKELYWPKCLNS